VDTRAVLYAVDHEADALLMRRAWNRVGLKNDPHGLDGMLASPETALALDLERGRAP